MANENNIESRPVFLSRRKQFPWTAFLVSCCLITAGLLLGRHSWQPMIFNAFWGQAASESIRYYRSSRSDIPGSRYLDHESYRRPSHSRGERQHVSQKRVSSPTVNILIPLYIWPGGNAWQPVVDQMNANPNLGFILILNPDSGPGTLDIQSAYLDGLRQLRSTANQNVKLIGYVAQGRFKTRRLTTVQNDVSRWLTFYRGLIDGIFFDESPVGGDQQISQMQSMNSFVRVLHRRFRTQPIIYQNPGTVPDVSYWTPVDQLADSTIIFENNATQLAASLNHDTTANLPSRSALGAMALGVDASIDPANLIKNSLLPYVSTIYVTSYPAPQADGEGSDPYAQFPPDFARICAVASSYTGN
jgi:hypothetical protein